MNGKYVPHPIDTSMITVPSELNDLGEMLAKNTHELWAQQRIEQGWSYGPRRNDLMRLHPCLIPYEDLPDSEKQYDRTTSMETIKLILSLGYRITKED